MTREEAIERLKNMAWLYGSSEREQNIEAIDMAIEALSESVADDTTRLGREYVAQDIQNDKGFIIGHYCRESIVRCGECKYFNDGDCTELPKLVSETDYCSYGERREPCD